MPKFMKQLPAAPRNKVRERVISITQHSDTHARAAIYFIVGFALGAGVMFYG